MCGYEGTGRALTHKLIKSLREKQRHASYQAIDEAGEKVKGARNDKKVHEERWKANADMKANLSSQSQSSLKVR